MIHKPAGAEAVWMSEIVVGGAVEALILAQMERRAAEMPDVALALVAAESDPETDELARWRGLCGVGVPGDGVRALVVPVDERQHPVVRAAEAGRMVCGAAASLIAGAMYWCAVPVSLTPGALPSAVLLALAAEPIPPQTQARLAGLADTLTAILAGAEAALRERRDTDQLTLLMRYAANPIILSAGTQIISMNEPAARLFDVAPAPDAEEQNEQVNALVRNLRRLRAFLARDFTEEVANGELDLEDPRTQEPVVMAIAASHVPDALGTQPGIVSVLHDMTRARELEDHRVRQQLFESEKLAATGRMAASIAHEINNPLEAIKNALYLLVQRSDPADPDYQFLELAQRETERVSRIIRQMLGVARPSVAFAPTDINEVVREALQLLVPQLDQAHIVANVTLDDHLPRVMASADQLKQVFLNLLLNAKGAMPHGGGLLVQTRIAHESDDEFLAGRHVIVRIRDDGAGIEPEILPRVFEPFFSTKPERQGTGLGLWVCQDIIQNHQGQILVRSKVGKGTTFLVALPFIRSSETFTKEPAS
jgi:signal transduction histidine kinase